MKISKTGVDKIIRVLKEKKIVISFYDVSSSEENKRLILLSQWGLFLIPFFLKQRRSHESRGSWEDKTKFEADVLVPCYKCKLFRLVSFLNFRVRSLFETLRKLVWVFEFLKRDVSFKISDVKSVERLEFENVFDSNFEKRGVRN